MKSVKNTNTVTRYVWTTKIGEKGQIVIPKEARDVFNLKKGDTLLLFGDSERGIAMGKVDDYIEFANRVFDGKGDNK